jgi:D-amino-acid dehydrogenase
VVLPQAALDLPVPIMPSDGRMANTLTSHGLRLAGQVELARPGDPPNWARADVLLAHARRTYPSLNQDERRRNPSRWMGHRPSTPDGLPVIGASPQCQGLWYACGHGHVGLAAAARTALWVAQGMTLASHEAPSSAWQDFGIGRFA